MFDSKQGGPLEELKLSVLLKGRQHAGNILRHATPRMILEKGLRFQHVGQRSALAAMVRHAVITNDVGGIAAIYDKCVTLWPSEETKYLAELAKAQGKIANAHHKLAAEILTQLFTKTSQPAINHVKEAVFGLKEGAAISHPTLKAALKVVPRGARVFVCARAQNGSDLHGVWQACTPATRLCWLRRATRRTPRRSPASAPSLFRASRSS